MAALSNTIYIGSVADPLFQFDNAKIDASSMDFEETVDALVEGSFLPLSVIIIGIGDADFKKMEDLDGDVKPLISRYGIFLLSKNIALCLLPRSLPHAKAKFFYLYHQKLSCLSLKVIQTGSGLHHSVLTLLRFIHVVAHIISSVLFLAE